MIARLVMRNCGPFKGTHSIALDAGAYAITARHESDRSKSNGVGKSFILEMIDFAITGRFNKSRGYDADGWITHGEKDASVAVFFEDGAAVERDKKRGQSTQIRFKHPTKGEAAQDAAAAAVLAYLALDADDFRNAAYFEQRKMAKLVDPEQTNPRERLDIVSGWFGLGLAERAEDMAAERASDNERELTRLTSKREVIESRLTTEVPDLAALEATMVARQAEMARLKAEKKEAGRIEEARRTATEQKKRIKEGFRLREELAKLGDTEARAKLAEDEMTELRAAHGEAKREEVRRKQVSLGLFDGTCPVASVTCPVTEVINADRKSNIAAWKKAAEVEKEAARIYDLVRGNYTTLFEDERRRRDMDRDITRLRAEVQEHAPTVKLAKEYLITAPDFEAGFECTLDYQKNFNERMSDTEDALHDAAVQLGIAKNETAARASAEKELAIVNEEIAGYRKWVSMLLRARALFRQAQRNVAETNLAHVEQEANDQLGEAGVDLTVTARWERDADGPAKTCEECGAAFPTSRKIKTCERCGTARGQHTIQRLDFVLSDRSGALNDLGGVAMQLAAGAWLLGARHSPWSTAMLDEPFAACDGHNRRALATQLLKLLGRGVFRQCLIISHSPDTVDSYPNKIVIVAHADGSRTIEQV